ncbi:MAG: hypothetical protein ACKOTH_05730, partial [Solirubrobacterales bacterium]
HGVELHRRAAGGANPLLDLGRQVDPRRATRDLWRLEEWERRRMKRAGGSSPAADTLPAR